MDRSLVLSWLNRGTLHLVRAEDYPWLLALTVPPGGAGNARRLAQEGVSPTAAERSVSVIVGALSDEGPLTRGQLRERLAARGTPWSSSAVLQLLFLASRRGLIVRGPFAGREQAFVLVRDWLGVQPLLARETALIELARRFLAGHGPATDRDLAQWAGISAREARVGLRSLAPELRGHADGLVELRRTRPPAALPRPRLLGPYEPLLMGWKSREPVLAGHQGVVIGNGLFRPIALVGGRAVATWGLAAGVVTLRPFADLDAAVLVALAEDSNEVARFLGIPASPMSLPVQGRPGA